MEIERNSGRQGVLDGSSLMEQNDKPEPMLQNGDRTGLPLTPPERSPIPANLTSPPYLEQ
jgi:hypothetical protein